ncbi:MAG: glycosyltransferase family 4 protein [Muribaculaceae bacterium]|nr:glycosyltransferase family 4 protein [Muribaculaceae bacterium]
MNILIAHNDYGKYSGEEAVVDKMKQMLTSRGHTVSRLQMSTAGIRDSLTGKIKGFAAGLHSPQGIRAMREAIREFKPDVVNIHNLYPFITPAALRECQKAGVPVVMTIHNFRLLCPTGLFMRNNQPCEVCLKNGNEWGCIRYNCENSLLKSIGYAARNAVARKGRHYLDCVSHYACITDFQRRKLIEGGFPEERISVIPNAVDMTVNNDTLQGNYVAYSGRISREKGVDMIIEIARRHPEIPFRLAGVVRDKDLVDNLPHNVTLMGYLQGDELDNFYRDARFFVMASRWYEGFPMTILEAARFAKPMIAPNHGGFMEIIGEESADHVSDSIGLLFTPSDILSLESCILQLWNSPTLVTELGEKAKAKLISTYSTEVVAEQWEQLLQSLRQKQDQQA